MADNLLDKASILLTPTAYNDGSMLSIKPENGDGDFTFSRSSAATRVNAQGLVENVQIISSELVSNGNFSQIGTEEVSNGNFSQEGSELVTNGDFATDSDWNLGNGWSIEDGVAKVDNTNTNYISQDGIVSDTKTYAITFTILNYISGSIRLRLGNTYGDYVSGNGTYTKYIQCTTSNKFRVYSSPSGANLSIDNVSVKEVGQDWNLGTGWSIGDGVATHTGSQSLLAQYNIITIGKSYRISFDLTNADDSNYVRLISSQYPNGSDYKTDGTHVVYTSTNIAHFWIYGIGDVTITNISVKEVGQDWTFGTGWSVDQANSKAIHSGTVAGNITQNAFTSGKSYKVKWTQTNGKFISVYGDGLSSLISNSDVNKDYTVYFNSVSGGNISFRTNVDGAEVSNISVKEITDDTDLPRINYEGFSYQDSLGSEEIVNGGFATDSGWVTQSGWSISGGTANCDGTANNALRQNFSLPVGTLRIKFDVTARTQGIVNLWINKPAFTQLISADAIGSYEVDVVTTSGANNVFFYSASNFTGSIDNVSVKEVLGQEVVPDSGCGSWLLEGQSTNLITQSELFSDASWSNTRITITTNTSETLNPSGGNNSELVTQSSTDTNGGAIYKFFSFSATSYTYSIFAKIKDVPFISISETTSAGGTLRRSWFDLQNGTLGSINSAHTAKIESYGNGWYRCSITFTATAGTYSILNYLSNGNNSTTAIVSTGLYIYGAQLEQQSYATSYIPTSGATNTRLQDIANNSGNSTLINSTEGVLYAEIAALSSPVDSPKNITISDGTVNNYVRIEYYQDGRVYGNVYDGTSVAANFVVNQLNFNKVAIQYSSSGSKLYVNGTGVDFASKIFTSNTLNTIQFSSAAADSNYFYGKNKALAVYKEALTDANLRSLTYPNPVATTFDLDFDTIAEQFTFTRGSEATFVNAQGLIESTASNDAPRIDYSTGEKAFLLENQSTNLITYSSDFSQSYWIKQPGVVATYNTTETLSPDGTYNATKFIGNGSTGVYKASIGVSGVVSRSVYLKSVSGTTTAIFKGPNTNLPTPITLTITNEWQRFELIGDNGSALQGLWIDDITSDGLYMWGAQLEQQSYATSYIPTSGASATRNQELCNNATPVINSEEGTLYAEISALANDGTYRGLTISDGTNSNVIRIYYTSATNRITIEVRSSNVGVFTNNYILTDSTQFSKIAIKYKENDFALWVDGVEVGTDNSGNAPILLSELSFNNGVGTETFFGNTKGLKYYPKALADVQLEDLTTI